MADFTEYLVNAMAYAKNRIAKEMCEDKDIINQICSKINTDTNSDDYIDCKNNIKWKPDDTNKLWPAGNQKYFGAECKTDSDCSFDKNLKCLLNYQPKPFLQCGFDPDESPCGHCAITSKKTCLNLSTPVYKCPDNAKSMDDCESTVKKYNAINDATGSTGSTGYTEFAKASGLRYCEWHNDDIPDINNPSGGTCVYGNFTTKAYAEFPQTHSMVKKEGGVVPPYYYDRDNSKMYITPEYCNYFGLLYGTGGKDNSDKDNDKCEWTRTDDCPLIGAKCRHVCVAPDTHNTPGYFGGIKCNTDADCPSSDDTLVDGTMGKTKCINIDKSNPENKVCIGDSSSCVTTTADEILEFIVGNTLFNAIEGTKAMKDCVKNTIHDYADIKENFESKNNITEMFSKFNSISDKASKLSDSKYMENKKIIMKDVAGQGINLYLIKWNIYATQLGIPSINDIGFDYDEVVKKYPEICTNFKDAKFISIDKKQLTNNNIKRIYVYIGSNDWIKTMIKSLN